MRFIDRNLQGARNSGPWEPSKLPVLTIRISVFNLHYLFAPSKTIILVLQLCMNPCLQFFGEGAINGIGKQQPRLWLLVTSSSSVTGALDHCSHTGLCHSGNLPGGLSLFALCIFRSFFWRCSSIKCPRGISFTSQRPFLVNVFFFFSESVASCTMPF